VRQNDPDCRHIRLGGNQENTDVTLAEQLYRRLMAVILLGELASGAKLSEPALARQYGVSRGPLREALHRLQERKLITRSPNQGPRVVKPSVEALAELFAVREALEGMAARLAALHATEADIAQLRTIVSDATARHNRVEALPAESRDPGDHDFHAAIARCGRNTMLIDLLCIELYPLLRLYRAMLPRPAAHRATIEHEHIVTAIEDHDPDLAEMLMRRHIAANRVRREKALAARNEPPSLLSSPGAPKAGRRSKAARPVDGQGGG
jgi:DNA-binding GntR family transcriptional regulator